MEPCIAQETFVAPNATLIGNVELDDESGVWYGTVIRGDENAVHIGMLTNIYENCLVTADCEVSGAHTQTHTNTHTHTRTHTHTHTHTHI